MLAGLFWGVYLHRLEKYRFLLTQRYSNTPRAACLQGGHRKSAQYLYRWQIYELKKQNLRAATAGDATLREIDVGSAKSHESGFWNCSSSRSFYITLVSHDIYYRTGQEILEQIGTPAISTKLCPANEISCQRGGRAGNKACDMLTTFAYGYRESRDTWGPARGLVDCYSNVILN